MGSADAELATAELEVLKALWEIAPATVRDVMNHLHDRGRTVAYTTVLTFLARLEQKNFVRSDKSGVAYVYEPRISREKVSKSRLQNLLEEMYDGAAGPLVLQLVRERRFTPDEIEQLQQLIEELDPSSSDGHSRRASSPRAKNPKGDRSP